MHMRNFAMLQISRARALIADSKAISSLEYAVLAAGVVVAVGAGAVSFGHAISTYFNGLAVLLGL
jgi:Flp pilus assembly pilin Flp